MKAIVLAAGKGVRMLPLTEDRPKVLVEVLGRPFLWYVLKNLRDAGVRETGLIVGYKKEKVEEFVEGLKETLPELKITMIEQKEQLGTAHATALAKHFVGNETFLSINGDNLYSPRDLKELMEERENTIAAVKVADPSRYGVLEIKGDRLIKIIEKPKEPPSNLINTAAYVFTYEIFDAIENIEKSERGEFEITDAITLLANQGNVKIHIIKDYWKDFGKKEDIPLIEDFLKKLG
ncbi:MAG: sugar phosphate nucleotidyltransferase [Candidatus Aenigmatarchaeota archaeon]